MKRWFDLVLGGGKKPREGSDARRDNRQPPDIDVMTFDGADISPHGLTSTQSESEALSSGETTKLGPTPKQEEELSEGLSIVQLFQEEGLVDLPELADKLEGERFQVSEPMSHPDGIRPVEGPKEKPSEGFEITQGFERAEHPRAGETTGFASDIMETMVKTDKSVGPPEQDDLPQDVGEPGSLIAADPDPLSSSTSTADVAAISGESHKAGESTDGAIDPGSSFVEISFGNNGTSDTFVKTGWYGAETSARWTEGWFSILNLPLRGNGDWAVLMRIVPYVASGYREFQRCAVLCRDTVLAEFELRNPGWVAIRIPEGLIEAITPTDTTLIIVHPDPGSPKEHRGFADDRLLALAVHTVVILPISELSESTATTILNPSQPFAELSFEWRKLLK